MATYEYTCENGHYQDIRRPMVAEALPVFCDECGVEMRRVYTSSLLVFGDFIIGDDDFSRRYHLNGAAGANGGKPNRTQGKTNINGILRRWGKNGRPLELNPDIDVTRSWDTSKGTPPGVDPTTIAPVELQSSSARGTHLKDEG